MIPFRSFNFIKPLPLLLLLSGTLSLSDSLSLFGTLSLDTLSLALSHQFSLAHSLTLSLLALSRTILTESTRPRPFIIQTEITCRGCWFGRMKFGDSVRASYPVLCLPIEQV